MIGSRSTQERIADVLRASPVFSSLSVELLDALAAAMQLQDVKGGEQVLREGDPADSILFVISGGLRVWRQSQSGERLLYNQVHPGQSVGELAMILQQPRAQDATALRDSTLALLSRQAYERLLLAHPLELNRLFLKIVADRLRNANDSGERRLAQTFMVLPLHGDPDSRAAAGQLARQLSQALGCLGQAGHLVSHPTTREGASLNGEALSLEALSRLDDGHDYLVYEGEGRDSSWNRYAFRHADQLVFVALPGRPARLTPIEQALSREPGCELKRKHLVLLHEDATRVPQSPLPWHEGRQLERIYPQRQGSAADVARLARFLTGQAVGLVLGGGGARGFAHLGVLRAFTEKGVPVDLIGGNSMGALIGAQIAMGASLEEVLEQTQRFAAGGERPTLPLVSLVAGRRVERDLQKLFGDRRIEQLWCPYFAAACNLSRGETTVLDSGLLWRAVLASNSPAGLLPPVLQNGELLVDGAILENVPVQPMRMRLGTPLERRRGNGQIVAIDVDAREELRADPGLQRMSASARLRHKLRPEAPMLPGIADILYAAGHIGGLNQRSRTIAQADVYLQPPVGRFPLMAYQRAAEIAELGYRHAMEQSERWQKLIAPTAPSPTTNPPAS